MAGNMVDPLKVSTNRSKLLDSLDFIFNFFNINPEILKDLYIKQNLSSRQIASQFRTSKNSVLKKINELGFKKENQKSAINSKNPPYGYKFKGGKLVQNSTEIRICKSVVKLKESGLSYRTIARHLEDNKILNRHQKIKWSHTVVSKIYRKWNQDLGGQK